MDTVNEKKTRSLSFKRADGQYITLSWVKLKHYWRLWLQYYPNGLVKGPATPEKPIENVELGHFTSYDEVQQAFDSHVKEIVSTGYSNILSPRDINTSKSSTASLESILGRRPTKLTAMELVDKLQEYITLLRQEIS